MQWPQLFELFPDVDYGFSMKMRPCGLSEFFAATAENEEILSERRNWLDSDPRKYIGLASEEDGLLDQMGSLASKCGLGAEDLKPVSLNTIDAIENLGRLLEADFLMLSPNETGDFVLQAGCVCFPSSWSLDEKIGKPLSQIHAVVPGLNEQIADRINTFLARMKPGVGWLRANWGISSSHERNQHPSRRLRCLKLDTDPGNLWVRIEHQLLTRLENSNAVTFGIRLENVALSEARKDERVRIGLRRALSTMSEAMLQYKNLASIRSRLIDYLS